MMLNKKRIGIMVYLLMVVVLLFNTSAYSADYANPQLLVTPADIEKNSGKWIVLDCRARRLKLTKTQETFKGYADGHIPDAVNLGGDCAKALRTKETSTVFTDPKDPKNMM